MGDKKKIVYFNSHFFDVDVTVIRELSKYYTIEWFVLLHESRDYYSAEYFKNYVKGLDVTLHLFVYKCRQRDWNFCQLTFRAVKEAAMTNSKLFFTSFPTLYLLIAYKWYMSKTPLVFGVHDVKLHSSNKIPLPLKLAMRWMLRTADYFVTYSFNQYHLFQQLYPNKVCSNVGLSIRNHGTLPIKVPHKNICTRFLFFGTISKYKGYDLLIEQTEILCHEGYSNFHLSINGNGPSTELDEIRQKAIHKSMYDLNLRFIKDKEIPELYSTNHFAVLPYRDATQSGPLMIAVGYGIPIIAPNFGIFSEVYTNNVDAILYDPKDEQGLHNALLKAIALTDIQYQNLRQNCIELKGKYSESKIVENYSAFFNSILKDDN